MDIDICKEEVFQKVFYQHAEHVRNFMYYKSGNLSQAEDLVQDAFGKLWENCSKVTLEKVKSYLFTIANNLFLNQVAHHKVVLNFEKKPHSEMDIQDPQYILEEKEFKDQLEKAISALPENQRIVFLMNRMDKKKYREIALELNISVKAVEKRMHKALKKLREIHKKV